MSQEIVDIYQGEAFVLSNFSVHEITFKGETYKTAEHCYHCQRYDDKKIIHKIKNARSPDEAWQLNQKYKTLQNLDFDEKKVSLMKEILIEKLSQHSSVRSFLMSTGNRLIEKHIEDDGFWGTGVDGNGKNILGKLWMEIKEGNGT